MVQTRQMIVNCTTLGDRYPREPRLKISLYSTYANRFSPLGIVNFRKWIFEFSSLVSFHIRVGVRPSPIHSFYDSTSHNPSCPVEIFLHKSNFDADFDHEWEVYRVFKSLVHTINHPSTLSIRFRTTILNIASVSEGAAMLHDRNLRQKRNQIWPTGWLEVWINAFCQIPQKPYRRRKWVFLV